MYVIQCTQTGYFDFNGPTGDAYDCYARKGQFLGRQDGEEASAVSNINSKHIMVFPTRKDANETRYDILQSEFLEDGDTAAKFTVVKVERTITLAAQGDKK